MDAINSAGATNSQITEIITTMDIIDTSLDAISTDFGDVNYDKSLDILVLLNNVVDKAASIELHGLSEITQMKDVFINKIRPAVQKLVQFRVYRTNYLKAALDVEKMTGQYQYDVQKMTGQLEQSYVAAEQNIDNQYQAAISQPDNIIPFDQGMQESGESYDQGQGQSQSQSQSLDKPKVRTLSNPNAGHIIYPMAS